MAWRQSRGMTVLVAKIAHSFKLGALRLVNYANLEGFGDELSIFGCPRPLSRLETADESPECCVHHSHRAKFAEQSLGGGDPTYDVGGTVGARFKTERIIQNPQFGVARSTRHNRCKTRILHRRA